jgi:hypothetical protein
MFLNRLINKFPNVFGYNFFREKQTKNDIQLAQLRDIHKGQRAFLIGSGPSLQISDLDKIKNEISFACNKIYLAFDDTEWRPSYYSVIDRMVAKNNYETIKNVNSKKIFSETIKPYFPDTDDILWLKDLPSPIINGRRTPSFSKDIVKGVYGGYTVIYTMLQTAFFMGLRSIILLGIDFSFDIPKPTGQKTSAGEILLKNDHEQNHFHPDYRKPGEIWTMPRLDIQYETFKLAKSIFENSGRVILNASRKTKLDVFPLVDFDSIL